MIARCHECTFACVALQLASSRAPHAAEPLLICIAKLSRSVSSCAFADACMQVEPQALSAYCSGSRVAVCSRCTMCSLIEFPVLLLLVIVAIVFVATTTALATTITTTTLATAIVPIAIATTYCHQFNCHCHCHCIANKLSIVALALLLPFLLPSIATTISHGLPVVVYHAPYLTAYCWPFVVYWQALSAYCSRSRVARHRRCTMCSLIEFPALLLLVIVLVVTTTTIATTIATTILATATAAIAIATIYLLPQIRLLLPLPLYC